MAVPLGQIGKLVTGEGPGLPQLRHEAEQICATRTANSFHAASPVLAVSYLGMTSMEQH